MSTFVGLTITVMLDAGIASPREGVDAVRRESDGDADQEDHAGGQVTQRLQRAVETGDLTGLPLDRGGDEQDADGDERDALADVADPAGHDGPVAGVLPE